MEELENIVAEVKTVLEAKKLEIDKAGSPGVQFVMDAYEKRRTEVYSFEQSMVTVNKDENEKKAVIAKFKDDARFLIGEINSILV